MPDRAVEAGKFDRPGMMGMESMDMGGKHDMEGMEQKPAHHGMPMKGEHEKPTPPGTTQETSTPRGGKNLVSISVLSPPTSLPRKTLRLTAWTRAAPGPPMPN